MAAAVSMLDSNCELDKLTSEIFSILENKFLFGYDDPRNSEPANDIFPLEKFKSGKHITGKVRILSIDGGGSTDGVLAGKSLVQLESNLQLKSGDPTARIADYFDVVAGSGAGGILAALLFTAGKDGRPLLTAREALNFIVQNRRKILKSPATGVLRRFFRSSEDVFGKRFGELTLKDTLKAVLVPCYDLTTGVDPKFILCEFYKVGQCAKGFKCKFSHDLNVQRKGEKIDIYSDTRDEGKDTMEDWDQDTLEKVVASKGQEYNQNKPADIVCKHFLDAVEKQQYGWFWVCPNGGKNCHYRHALPPGYVLKSQMTDLLEEETEKTTVEEDIENQRAKLTTSTPMTPELFMQWKKKKIEARDAGLAAQMAERAKNDRMSGRELFLSDSSLFVDDAEAYDKYQRDDNSMLLKRGTIILLLQINQAPQHQLLLVELWLMTTKMMNSTWKS